MPETTSPMLCAYVVDHITSRTPPQKGQATRRHQQEQTTARARSRSDCLRGHSPLRDRARCLQLSRDPQNRWHSTQAVTANHQHNGEIPNRRHRSAVQPSRGGCRWRGLRSAGIADSRSKNRPISFQPGRLRELVVATSIHNAFPRIHHVKPNSKPPSQPIHHSRSSSTPLFLALHRPKSPRPAALLQQFGFGSSLKGALQKNCLRRLPRHPLRSPSLGSGWPLLFVPKLR
jgi:hypothetical protein